MSAEAPELHLHTYFRSSCSARLRIALRLKSLPFTETHVHLLKGEQSAPAYTTLNPSASVPVLTHGAGAAAFPITQSLAALEYLEDAFPNSGRPLLPAKDNAVQRAQVRTLVAIVACDVQPPTNLRLMRAVGALAHPDADGASADQRTQTTTAWAREWTERGLKAFEAVLARTQPDDGPGKFCVGDRVSLADVCLVPAVWAAQRWGCDLAQFPRLMRVFAELEAWDEVKAAHWRRQPDTPAEFREE